MLNATETSATVDAPNLSPSMLSVGATLASETAMPGETAEAKSRPLPSSSALLTSFARELFSEKILPSLGQMRLGLGGDLAENSNRLDMLCSPSGSGRVALGLTIDGSACSCSPRYRTPTARDWKGMSAKSWRERDKGDKTPTLPDQIGGVPHPEFVEELMGFPIGWTALKASETPSSRRSRK